ncbi:MAG: hypothetical protein NTW49_06125 [Bacteroidia bacterium]|nr:hypothetical protein [Bacteroidia bacterium]
MNTFSKIISLFLLISIGSWITPQKVSAQEGAVNFQVFYDELSPYGTWVDNPDYGYVWLPDVAPGFIPYRTNGYWIFTDEGWTWVSNYRWGWAPFHYGRWHMDPIYGPMWVPDNEWGPGWVTWRRSPNYYGWAPIEPGVSISMAYSNDYNVPEDHWTFVRNRDFGRRNINHYYVNHSTNVTIIKYSTVINNTRVENGRDVTYNAGPERGDVEKHIGRPISPVAIKESGKPGQNMNKNELQIYRPKVQKNTSAGAKPAPSKVANMKEVKSREQRAAEIKMQKSNQPAAQKASQPRLSSPSNKVGGEKQQQVKPGQKANPSKKTEGMKQQQQAKPSQQASPSKGAEGVRQQQAKPGQHANPSKGVEGVKQQQANPNQQTVPSKKDEGMKQQKQVKPTKHINPPKKEEEVKQPQQPQQANPPQKTEETPPH